MLPLPTAVCPLTAVQIEWSVYRRDAEREMVPLLRQLGIGIVAYNPFGRARRSGTNGATSAPVSRGASGASSRRASETLSVGYDPVYEEIVHEKARGCRVCAPGADAALHLPCNSVYSWDVTSAGG